MEVELDKYRAACAGKLDEETVGLVMRSVQGEGSTTKKRSTTVTVSSNKMVATASDVKKFNGDAPAILTSSADGVLSSTELDTLYNDTISYTFTPGAVDNIDFKDDGNAILGTWKGKFKPALTDSFTYPGTWG